MGRKSRNARNRNKNSAESRRKRERTNEAEHEIRSEIPYQPLVMIIPGGGQLMEVANEYATQLLRHHRANNTELSVSIFEYDPETANLVAYIDQKVGEITQQKDFKRVEIHAQGGLGAYVACKMLQSAWEQIKRVFFIGGAPSESLSSRAKFFHQRGIDIWRWLHYKGLLKFTIKFPNPYDNPLVKALSERATIFVRRYPELYYNQIKIAGSWTISPLWLATECRAWVIDPLLLASGCKAYYISGGNSQIGLMQAEMYDYAEVASHWYKHNVVSLRLFEPEFCPETLMPTKELFTLMDEARNFD